MLKLGASYSEQVSSSEVVQISTEGVEQLETYFGKYLPQLFYNLIAPLALFLILCRVSVKASVILLICVPLIPISIVVVQKIAKKLLNKYWSIYTGLGDSFLENLQGLTTLKIYQADQQKADEMDVESQNFRRITMKVLTMQLNSTSVMDIAAYGGAAIGMAVRNMSELKPRITENGIDYILVGDYYIPDLKLPEEHRPIGKYGRMHREYLREAHPARLNTLTLTGELWTYLADLNEQAQERLDTIMEQMKAADGVTEELKRTHQMEWVQRCNNIHNRAEEIILQEMIYS